MRLAGSRKCNKNPYKVCKNVIKTDTFQSFLDKKVYKINHRFTSSNVSSTSCHVRYVVCDTTVKLITELGTSGITSNTEHD